MLNYLARTSAIGSVMEKLNYKFNIGYELTQKAKSLIPAGAHT